MKIPFNIDLVNLLDTLFWTGTHLCYNDYYYHETNPGVVYRKYLPFITSLYLILYLIDFYEK